MTQSLVKDYALLAKDRELQVDISLTHQQAYINPSVMKLILSNLIGNAIKHSIPGGLSRIEREKRNSISRIAVVLRNKKNCPVFFLDNASRKAKGSGMGLFVVKFIRTRELPYHFEMQAIVWPSYVIPKSPGLRKGKGLHWLDWKEIQSKVWKKLAFLSKVIKWTM